MIAKFANLKLQLNQQLSCLPIFSSFRLAFKLVFILPFLLAFIIHVSPLGYAQTTVNQEIKLQFGNGITKKGSLLATQGVNNYQQNTANYRWRFDLQKSNWSFDFDYVLNGEYNTALDTTQQFANTQTESSNWFDWSATLKQNNKSIFQHRVDRANISYSNALWTVKLGRQAITWGNGILFHPMDLFNPFSPSAIDTSYKPGVDMLYVQRLFDSGADLQMLWLPRKNTALTQALNKDSYAAKYLFFYHELQLEVMLADDYGDKAAAVGVVGSFNDAVWKLDVVFNELNHNDLSQSYSSKNYYSLSHYNKSYFNPSYYNKSYPLSLAVNMQYSWGWRNKSVNGFIEYYRNGFAPKHIDSLESIDTFNPELTMRLKRGQLFSLGKDQLAMGLQIQWTPLFTINPSVIYQLNDNSQMLLVNANYSSGDNSAIIFGGQLAFGDKGSQYGGRFLTAAHQITAAPTNLFYLRYEVYF